MIHGVNYAARLTLPELRGALQKFSVYSAGIGSVGAAYSSYKSAQKSVFHNEGFFARHSFVALQTIGGGIGGAGVSFLIPSAYLVLSSFAMVRSAINLCAKKS